MIEGLFLNKGALEDPDIPTEGSYILAPSPIGRSFVFTSYGQNSYVKPSSPSMRISDDPCRIPLSGPVGHIVRQNSCSADPPRRCSRRAADGRPS